MLPDWVEPVARYMLQTGLKETLKTVSYTHLTLPTT